MYFSRSIINLDKKEVCKVKIFSLKFTSLF